MTIFVNGTEKNITMHVWENNQWSCDFFGDIETNVSDEDEMTEEEYKSFIKFWRDEVDNYNAGNRTECLGERYIDGEDEEGEEEEIDCGEYVLFIN